MWNRIVNFFLLPLAGVCRVVAYQNIYKSGYYHRAGKPGQFDRHPGDLYPTRAAAEADVYPPVLYLDTVKVVWYEQAEPHVNCANSHPVPLRESRRRLLEDGGEYRDGEWHAPPEPVPYQCKPVWNPNDYPMWWGSV